MLSQLIWAGGNTGMLLGVLLLIVGGVLCWLGWSRSGYTKLSGISELLRFLIFALIALTIFQPEIIKRVQNDERPKIVILTDDSKSMGTVDVVKDDGEKSRISRREAIDPYVSQEFWEPLRDRFDVEIRKFSTSSSDKEIEDNANAVGTDLNSALVKVKNENTNLRGIVLFTDADWNIGQSPTVGATQLRMSKVPIYGVLTGSEIRLPDIELTSFEPPTFGVPGKNVSIPFTITSSLPKNQNIEIELTGTDGALVKKSILIEAFGTVEDSILWTPKEIGETKLTLKIPVQEKEVNKINNEITQSISVQKEELKVLLIESKPRWEYRYLRNALDRDPGVEVQCLLFHSSLGSIGGGEGYLKEFPSEEELVEYDVIYLGDVGAIGGQLTEEQCSQIAGVVRNQAVGLVFLPGFQGNQATLLETQLKELYPVHIDKSRPQGWGTVNEGRLELTETGRDSLLTKLENSHNANLELWNRLPGFKWYTSAERAKIGSEVLVVHSSEMNRFGRIPLVVTKTLGTGKILFMGTDGAWRWRKGVEDKYHYKFWGQTARWMAYQRKMANGEKIRLFYSPERPELGSLVSLNVNATSDSGEPVSKGKVIMITKSPSGKIQSLALKSTKDNQWGLFQDTFVPKETGTYEVEISCEGTSEKLQTEIVVSANEIEKIGLPARSGVLRDITKLTYGEIVTFYELDSLVNKIQNSPEPELKEYRIRIWANWFWGVTILCLMTLFWIVRKISGVM